MKIFRILYHKKHGELTFTLVDSKRDMIYHIRRQEKVKRMREKFTLLSWEKSAGKKKELEYNSYVFIGFKA